MKPRPVKGRVVYVNEIWDNSETLERLGAEVISTDWKDVVDIRRLIGYLAIVLLLGSAALIFREWIISHPIFSMSFSILFEILLTCVYYASIQLSAMLLVVTRPEKRICVYTIIVRDRAQLTEISKQFKVIDAKKYPKVAVVSKD